MEYDNAHNAPSKRSVSRRRFVKSLGMTALGTAVGAPFVDVAQANAARAHASAARVAAVQPQADGSLTTAEVEEHLPSSVLVGVPQGALPGTAFTLATGEENSPSGGRPETHGPFQIFIGGAWFNGSGAYHGLTPQAGDIWDPYMSFGYNTSLYPAGDPGGLVVAGEPAAMWVVEADYNGTARTMEMYTQYQTGATWQEINNNGSPTWNGALRPFSTQVNRFGETPEYFLNECAVVGNPFVIHVPDNTMPGGSAVRPVLTVEKSGTVAFGSPTVSGAWRLANGGGTKLLARIHGSGEEELFQLGGDAAGPTSMNFGPAALIDYTGLVVARSSEFPSGGEPRVGVGTAVPAHAFHVAVGDLAVTTVGQGVILTDDSNGHTYRLNTHNGEVQLTLVT